MPSLCLNMIVRNEADKIIRCLKSVSPYISYAAIVDTGSTDGTPDLMADYFNQNGIPHKIKSEPFRNFEQARNAALGLARAWFVASDYVLLVDADMELVVDDPKAFDIANGGASYLMTQRAGGLAYHNTRLLKTKSPYKYIGVTHEYVDAPHAGLITGAHFKDHADGNNRGDKYSRDVKLLVDALQDDPDNGRSWFYLAQSYREMGQWHQALACYQRRVELGGWDEEVWNAQFNIAHCHHNLGDEGKFILGLLLAYKMRPSRSEPLYDLAHHFREKGWNAPAALFAEVGLKIPYSKDSLFVNEFVYRAGLKEEFAITGFYDERTKKEAFEVCNALSLLAGDYAWPRHTARCNLYHYLPSLDRVVRSFRPERIDFTPPEGWTALNPSVASRGAELCCVVRTVNYVIKEDGSYAINGPDGSVNNENPINTRNYLCKFDNHDWARGSKKPHTVREIIYNQNYPAKYMLVRGFEDMRLITHGANSDLFISACVREMESDGVCQQVLAGIGKDHVLRDIQPIHRLPREYEKNWMPILRPGNEPIQFMYRLNHVVDEYGRDVVKHPNTMDVGHISGGSQVIPFFGGWVALVHEAMQHENYAQRYYQHRFAYFNHDLSLEALSLPFVFFDRQIEFAAGLCQSGEFDLVMSFGVRDKEAWMARIDVHDVLELKQCQR